MGATISVAPCVEAVATSPGDDQTIRDAEGTIRVHAGEDSLWETMSWDINGWCYGKGKKSQNCKEAVKTIAQYNMLVSNAVSLAEHVMSLTYGGLAASANMESMEGSRASHE